MWPRKCKNCIVGKEIASFHCDEHPTPLNKQFYAQLEICAVDYRTDYRTASLAKNKINMNRLIAEGAKGDFRLSNPLGKIFHPRPPAT